MKELDTLSEITTCFQEESWYKHTGSVLGRSVWSVLGRLPLLAVPPKVPPSLSLRSQIA